MKPDAHVQLYESPLLTQVPSFKQGLGRHVLGTVQTYHHYIGIIIYLNHNVLAQPYSWYVKHEENVIECEICQLYLHRLLCLCVHIGRLSRQCKMSGKSFNGI